MKAMDRTRTLLAALLACVLLAGLAGCGSAGGSADHAMTEETTAAYEDGDYAAGMTAPEAKAEDAGGTAGSDQGKDAVPADLSQMKIVYTGSVAIDSTEYDQTVRDIRALIDQYHCIVERANESNYDQSWRDAAYNTSAREYSWTLRVPSGQFSDLMDSFGTVHGHISSKNQDAEDLTRQYRDNESRIASLKAQESRLLAFMEEAESISEMLEIEDRLSDVRYELEQLQNRNNDIDLMAQYSTLTVRVTEVVEYSSAGLSFGQRVAQAWSTSGNGFVHALQGLIILVIWLLPWLAIAAVVLMILFLTRNRRADRRARRQEAKRQKAEAKRAARAGAAPEKKDRPADEDRLL